MEGLDVKAIIAGDASSFVKALDDSIAMVEKFRTEQAQTAAVGQHFEMALNEQGISIEEWARALDHAKQQATETKGVTGALADELSQFGSVGKEAGEVLRAFGDAGAAGALGASALIGSISAVTEFGNKLANLKSVTQLSTETLAAWEEQAPVFGVNAQTMAMAMERLGQRAEQGTKQASEGLRELGMTTEQYLSLSPQQRFEDVTHAIAQIEDPAKKASVAMELFGRGGIQMLPALTEEAEKYRDRLHEIGMNTDEAAEKGRKWKELTNELSVAWHNVYMSIGLATGAALSGDAMGAVTALGIMERPFSMRSQKEQEAIFASSVKGGASTTGTETKYFEETEEQMRKETEARQKNADIEEKLREKSAREAERIEKEKARAIADVMNASEKDMDRYYKEQQRLADATARGLIKDYYDREKADEEALKEQVKAHEQASHQVERDWTDFAESYKRHIEEEVAKAHDLANAFTGFAGLLQQLGVTADSVFGKMISDLSNLGQVGAKAFEEIATTGMLSWNTLFAGIGSVVGVFKDLFGGDKVIMQLNDQRDAWFQNQGGVDAVVRSLNEMGTVGEDARVIIQQLYDAKTPEEFKAAVDAVNAAMNEGKEANQALDDAMKKYGISISQLGPTFRQQKMDEEAKALIKDYEVLKGAGVDQSVIIQKMGGDFNKYVQESMKAGTAIPENLRPVIEAMEKAGTLTDAAGNKITDMSKIKFTASLTEGLQSAVDAINKLVAALQNMYGYANQQAAGGGIRVPVSTTGPSSPAYGPPGTTGAPYQAQSGFFSPSMPPGPLEGGGTALVVHPGEYVSVRPTEGQFGGGGVQGGGGVTLRQENNLHLGTLIGSPEELMVMIAQAVGRGNPDLVQAIQSVAWRSAG